MGKTPVLPLFAAALGAAELMTGLIVAVSTSIGMVLKPLFGSLSDRSGRKLWFFIALAIFSTLPFLYQFVSTSEQLLSLRLAHGFATAIFGPVSLAYVAELGRDNVASNLAVFGMARSIAGLTAPLSAGILLTFYPVETVFTLIGFLSLTAAVPLLRLKDPSDRSSQVRKTILRHLADAFQASVQTSAVWLAGGLELIVYMVTYGAKAFLPLFILSQESGTVFLAGLFFTVQEGIHIVLRPICGRLADRYGFSLSIRVGMLAMALGLVALTHLPGSLILSAALLIGAAQAMILPASVAMLARASQAEHKGAGMGFYGALRNLGKVLGPVIAGGLLSLFDFGEVFTGFAICIAGVAVVSTFQQRRVQAFR